MHETTWPPDIAEHLADVRAVLRSARTCHEGVTRRGEFQPCEKLAVAVRIDPDGRKPYPVCAYHAYGDMVSLPVMVAALGGGNV